MPDTPNIHLTLGPDAADNENWEKIDAFIGLLQGPGVILPGDTLVQGNLEVQGDADFDGLLRAHGALEAFSNSAFLGNVNISGLLTALGGLTVQGAQPVIFPPVSIQQPALAPNASLQGVWVGNPVSGQFALSTSPIAGAAVNTDAREVTGRWELVIASITMQVSVGPGLSATLAPTWTLNRGATVQQSRAFSYTTTGAALVGTAFSVPMVLARFANVTDVTPANQVWSVWGSVGSTPVAGSGIQHIFSQVVAVQFT